jgi:hypothetical protein
MKRLCVSHIESGLYFLVLVVFSSAGAGQTNAACVGCPTPIPCTGCWQPAQESRWQYQLSGVQQYSATGGINTAITAVPFGGGAPVTPQVFDIDLYVDSSISGTNNTPDTAAVRALHQAGAKAVCYIDAGTWENWRPDAAAFVSYDNACGGCLLGRPNGWPGERWLNIKQLDFLLPLMEARVRVAQQAGYDGVEFDNVDGYANNTGFPLTPNDQLLYNTNLANVAHTYGLSVGLKNDLDQVGSLVSYYEYAINEQCFPYRECQKLQPFLAAGKAVFEVEYTLSQERFCPRANSAHFNSISKSLALKDVPWTPCR